MNCQSRCSFLPLMVCLSEDTFKVCYLIDNEQEMRRDGDILLGEHEGLTFEV